MPINKWNDKGSVASTHNRILSSLKNEGNSVIRYDMDEHEDVIQMKKSSHRKSKLHLHLKDVHKIVLIYVIGVELLFLRAEGSCKWMEVKYQLDKICKS